MAKIAAPAMVALKIVGTLAEGAQQEGAIRQQAALADYNARVSEANAAAVGQQTSAAEDAHRRRVREFMGAQRAAFAANGGGFDGSNADVARQTAVEAELDALTIRYKGNLERAGLLADASQNSANAQHLLSSAKRVRNITYLRAATGILSSAAPGGEFNPQGQGFSWSGGAKPTLSGSGASPRNWTWAG